METSKVRRFIIVMDIYPGLSLKPLAENFNYSLPKTSTPWMEKTIDGSLVRITRDNDKNLWSICFSGENITKKSHLQKTIRTVISDVESSLKSLNPRGLFYFREKIALSAKLKDCGYENGLKDMGNVHVKAAFHNNVLEVQSIGSMSGSGEIVFYADNMLSDLLYIKAIEA